MKPAFKLVVAILPAVAQAAELVDWTGGAEGSWESPENWTGRTSKENVVPSANDGAVFSVNPGDRIEVTSSATADFAVTNLWISGGGTVQLTLPENVTLFANGRAEDKNGAILGGYRRALWIDGSTLELNGGTLSHMLENNYNCMVLAGSNPRVFVKNGAHLYFRASYMDPGEVVAPEIHAVGVGSTVSVDNWNFHGSDGVLVAEQGGEIQAWPGLVNTEDFTLMATNGSRIVTSSARTLTTGVRQKVLVKDSELAMTLVSVQGDAPEVVFDHATVTGTAVSGSRTETGGLTVGNNNVDKVSGAYDVSFVNGTTATFAGDVQILPQTLNTAPDGRIAISNSTVSANGKSLKITCPSRDGAIRNDGQLIVEKGGVLETSGGAVRGNATAPIVTIRNGGEVSFAGKMMIESTSPEVMPTWVLENGAKLRGTNFQSMDGNSVAWQFDLVSPAEEGDETIFETTGWMSFAGDTTVTVNVGRKASGSYTLFNFTGDAKNAMCAKLKSLIRVNVEGAADYTITQTGQACTIDVKRKTGLMVIIL